MKSIYCPKCDKRVLSEVSPEVVPLKVRNVEVHARQLHAVCPYCGDQIADEKMSRYNLESALESYRASEDLLSSADIKTAYSQYGLTQSSFAKLLGLGGATLSRYEHGAVQTKQIDGAIRSACEPANMLSLLDSKGDLIPSEQLEAAKEIAQNLLESKESSEVAQSLEDLGNFRLLLSKEAPSALNGFRTLDWERATQMVVFLVGHCSNLDRTKLNKGMFYSDFVCFADTSRSMSGLRYARATRGPVVDGYDMFFGDLVRRGVLEELPIEYGQVETTYFSPKVEFDASLFSAGELVILENVAAFIDSFKTAKELSEYSHKEKLWIEHDDGQQFSYLRAFELNELDRFIGQ